MNNYALKCIFMQGVNIMNTKTIKNLEKLFNLIKENPNLPVIASVDCEIVADDDYKRWIASIGDCEIKEFAQCNDIWFDDINDFAEEYYNSHEYELCERFNYNPRITEYSTSILGKYTQEQLDLNNENEKKMNEYIDEICKKYIVKVIVVYIDLPEISQFPRC